ncbi:MAG: hypothetical protein M9894_07685 [Planctomycetes bacterium]|nr:hypothetical protein [Planctomycetota bacterium]
MTRLRETLLWALPGRGLRVLAALAALAGVVAVLAGGASWPHLDGPTDRWAALTTAPGPVARLAAATWAAGAAGALVLLQVVTGAAVMARLGLEPATPADGVVERRVVALAVGAWAWSLGLLVFAALGALGPGAVVALAAVSLGAAARWGSPPAPDPAPEGEASRWRWVPSIALLLWALPLLPQALLPNWDWDAALHHLPMAQRLLEGRAWEVDLDCAAFAAPFGAHLTYAALMAIGAGGGVAAYNLSLTFGTLLATVSIGRAIGGPRAGRWTGAVLVTVNIVWELGLDARVDAGLTFAVTAGALALVRWTQDRCPGRLATAGAALGLALAYKASAPLMVVVLGGCWAALVLVDRARGAALPGARPLALGLVLLAAPALFPYGRNLLATGDPLYPHLRKARYVDREGNLRPLAPDQAALVATRPVRDEDLADTRYAWANAEPGAAGQAPRSLLTPAIFSSPRRFSRKPLHEVGVFFPLALLLPLLAPSRSGLWLLAAGGLMFVAVGAQTTLLRYALPAFPLLAAAAGVALGGVRRRVPLVLVGLALSGHAGLQSWLEWRKLRELDPGGWFAGRVDEASWASQVGYNGVRAWLPTAFELNRRAAAGELGPAPKLFLVAEGKGDRLLVPYAPDQSWHGATWLTLLTRQGGDVAAAVAELEARGFTHIVVNHGYMAHNVGYAPSLRERVRLSLHTLSELERREARSAAEHEQERVVVIELSRERERLR